LFHIILFASIIHIFLPYLNHKLEVAFSIDNFSWNPLFDENSDSVVEKTTEMDQDWCHKM